MKFAICNEIFQDRSFVEQCETAAALGYTGLEIAPFTIAPKYDATKLDASYGEYLLETAQFHGLEIVGIHHLLTKTEALHSGQGLHLTSPDEQMRAETLKYIKHLADICYAMEGSLMVWDSAPQRNIEPNWPLDDCAHRAADLLREVAQYCEPLGITIAVSPLPHSETNFLTSAREAAILINLVDHSHCQLHLSARAMSYELDRETPGSPTPEDVSPTREQKDNYMGELVRHHHARLAHIHANDPNGLGPGMGETTHTAIATALRENKHQGWISVEASRHEPSPNDLARQSMAYLQETYR